MPEYKKKKKPKPYLLVLSGAVTGQKIECDSIVEGLSQFNLSDLRGKTVLEVHEGEKKAQRMFYPLALRRLLINKVAKEILNKRFTNALR